MKILVINGPSLNMLGVREPEVYGAKTYQELEAFINQALEEAGAEGEVFQFHVSSAGYHCISMQSHISPMMGTCRTGSRSRNPHFR